MPLKIEEETIRAGTKARHAEKVERELKNLAECLKAMDEVLEAWPHELGPLEIPPAVEVALAEARRVVERLHLKTAGPLACKCDGCCPPKDVGERFMLLDPNATAYETGGKLVLLLRVASARPAGDINAQTRAEIACVERDQGVRVPAVWVLTEAHFDVVRTACKHGQGLGSNATGDLTISLQAYTSPPAGYRLGPGGFYAKG